MLESLIYIQKNDKFENLRELVHLLDQLLRLFYYEKENFKPKISGYEFYLELISYIITDITSGIIIEQDLANYILRLDFDDVIEKVDYNYLISDYDNIVF